MTRLEQLRIDAKLSVKELAAAAGVSHQTILNLEQRKSTNPQVETLHKLAKPLGATPSELLRPAVWPPPTPDLRTAA